MKSEEPSVAYTAIIDVADYGSITVELDAETAPKTVENFVALANEGFYDGLTFHRIMDGFMIQGGDPDGDGTGGSEQTIKGEFNNNGVENNLSRTRGAISMARSNDYDSASSQFFIVHEDSTYLDGSYACFGYVTEGMDVVDAICADAGPSDNNGSIAAEEQPVIKSMHVSSGITFSDKKIFVGNGVSSRVQAMGRLAECLRCFFFCVPVDFPKLLRTKMRSIFVIFNPHEITSVYQNSRSSKELLRLFPEWQ